MRVALAFLQCADRNVFTVVCALEADLRASLIGALHGRFQFCGSRCHPEHASTGSIESSITFRGAGMKDFLAVQLRGIFQAGDLLAYLVGSRIAARSHHDAYR